MMANLTRRKILFIVLWLKHDLDFGNVQKVFLLLKVFNISWPCSRAPWDGRDDGAEPASGQAQQGAHHEQHAGAQLHAQVSRPEVIRDAQESP